jgi:hypothetical protein
VSNNGSEGQQQQKQQQQQQQQTENDNSKGQSPKQPGEISGTRSCKGQPSEFDEKNAMEKTYFH